MPDRLERMAAAAAAGPVLLVVLIRAAQAALVAQVLNILSQPAGRQALGAVVVVAVGPLLPVVLM